MRAVKLWEVTMSKQTSDALMAFNEACRRASITAVTAAKLEAKGQFPRIIWLANRRYVSRIEYETWIANLISGGSSKSEPSAPAGDAAVAA
jgi:predicted DNA-binding transcriptional regulator AlpA